MKRFAFALFLATVAVGCGDSGTGPDDSISGRYTLRTMNGGSLPYTLVQVGNDNVEITAGHIQMNTDGTFSLSLSSRTTQGGSTSTSTDSDSGTWTRSGNQVSFRFSDNSVDTGVIDGNNLTVISDNISFVFRK